MVSKRPTVYDVAARAGVSIATVSFAFRQPDRVRPTTLERVLQAATELGYVPSGSARGLAAGKTGAIGFYAFDYFLDDAAARAHHALDEDPSWSFPLYVDEVQRGVELECKRRGVSLFLSGERGTMPHQTVANIAGRVDALITFAETVPLDLLRRLSRSIPVLEFSQEQRDEAVNNLTVDNAAGLAGMVDHLATRHQARRFVFVGSLSTGEMVARHEGFTAALRRVPGATSGRIDGTSGVPDSVSGALADFIRGGVLPDVFVCATDQIALVLMKELDRRGIAVPADVAVTGFDGILAGRLSTPALSTVAQPMEALGRRAVEVVTSAIAAAPNHRVHETLPTRLVFRQSCGCN